MRTSVPSFRRFGVAALCAGITLALAGCGDSGSGPTSPPPPYKMPLSQATIQSAVDLFTTGTDTVPVQCGGTVPIDCPGGASGPVITISRARVVDSLFLQRLDTAYSFSAYVTLTSSQDIPVTIPVVGDCGLHLDTSAGSSPTVHLSGQAYFTSSVPAGPLDELALTFNLDGLEAADFSLSGGTACALANEAASFYVGTILSALGTGAPIFLCAGSGPGLFALCPSSPSAAERRRESVVQRTGIGPAGQGADRRGPAVSRVPVSSIRPVRWEDPDLGSEVMRWRPEADKKG